MNDNFAYCTDCKRDSEVVIDHKAGDTICTNCGLILEDLIKGFEIIATMVDSLSIVQTAKIRAQEMYKNLGEKKGYKEKKLKAVLAACLLIACEESKCARTVKEMCSIEEGISRKELIGSIKFIKKEIRDSEGLLNGSGAVKQYCSILGMSNQTIKAVEETWNKSKEFDIRKAPSSVLATIIFLVAQLSDHKIHIKDIGSATLVSERVIKKTYKDIYPYASRIIPRWYAEEDKIKKLHKPNPRMKRISSVNCELEVSIG